MQRSRQSSIGVQFPDLRGDVRTIGDVVAWASLVAERRLTGHQRITEAIGASLGKEMAFATSSAECPTKATGAVLNEKFNCP